MDDVWEILVYKCPAIEEFEFKDQKLAVWKKQKLTNENYESWRSLDEKKKKTDK